MKILTCLVLPGLLLTALPSLAANDDRLMRRANRYFEPLPETMPGSENDSPQKIALGKKLFFDKRLSINDSQSCASCHRLDQGFAGVDKLPISPGAKGITGNRNSPSVLNAGLQRLQFWDGRANDLVEQAKGPILSEKEMAMPDEQTLVNKLQAITEYRNDFKQAFSNMDYPISLQTISEAIAAFERTLITPSRFDDFLKGDPDALSAAEKQGLKSFIEADCTSCHDGMLLGGESLEQLGAERPYDNQDDPGLYSITQEKSDHMVFKVSQLRNIALTAPYFHDGRVATLEQAVKLMAQLQLDNDLSDLEIEQIVTFLKSLTDKTREP